MQTPQLTFVSQNRIPDISLHYTIIVFFLDYTTAGLAIISQQDPQNALIKYFPSVDEQRQYSDDGFSGQFVVRYDIDRELDAGDILVSYYSYDCTII